MKLFECLDIVDVIIAGTLSFMISISTVIFHSLALGRCKLMDALVVYAYFVYNGDI